MKPDILAVDKLPPFLEDRLRAAFAFHDRTNDATAFAAITGRVCGLVALGTSTVAGEFIAQLPALEIISVFGVGYDGIDIQAAHSAASWSPTRRLDQDAEQNDRANVTNS